VRSVEVVFISVWKKRVHHLGTIYTLALPITGIGRIDDIRKRGKVEKYYRVRGEKYRLYRENSSSLSSKRDASSRSRGSGGGSMKNVASRKTVVVIYIFIARRER